MFAGRRLFFVPGVSNESSSSLSLKTTFYMNEDNIMFSACRINEKYIIKIGSYNSQWQSPHESHDLSHLMNS